MRVLPVIDLKQGRVVHAVQGRRGQYAPVVSQLTRSSRPGEVAAAFAQCLGLTEIYIADLDAIGGAGPDWKAYQAIIEAGLSAYVDAGAVTASRLQELIEDSQREPGLAKIIVALEGLRDRRELQEAFAVLGRERSVFSLDLKQGRPFTTCEQFVHATPLEIVREVVAVGFQTLVVIDLHDVGAGQGPGVAPLCQRIREAHPSLEILAGGGVRSRADLHTLAECGCDAALVATALHNGVLTQKDLNV